jgi:hypothetical protein
VAAVILALRMNLVVQLNKTALLSRWGILFLLLVCSIYVDAQAPQRSKSSLRAEIRGDSYTVYPNPSSGKFSISVKELDQPFDINVYNLIGELVFRWQSSDNGPANVEVNLSKHAKGVYFVELDTDKGNVLKKIIIDHDKDN